MTHNSVHFFSESPSPSIWNIVNKSTRSKNNKSI